MFSFPPRNLFITPVSVSSKHHIQRKPPSQMLRNGMCFSMEDYTVCGRYQTDPQVSTVLSGKSMCLYEMGFSRQELVRKVADAAKRKGITASMVYCEMVLENVLPEKCLFQYFTGVHCDTAMGSSRSVRAASNRHFGDPFTKVRNMERIRVVVKA